MKIIVYGGWSVTTLNLFNFILGLGIRLREKEF